MRFIIFIHTLHNCIQYVCICIHINIHIYTHTHLYIYIYILHFYIHICMLAACHQVQKVRMNSKTHNLRIRDVSGLLCALHASGDQSLNAKLRSVGQKPFHWRTLQVVQKIWDKNADLQRRVKFGKRQTSVEALRFVTININNLLIRSL